MPHTKNGSVKLLMTYDPIPERQQEYFQYVLGEFLPALQSLGLPMQEVWHTAYGEYPLRLLTFVSPDLESLGTILNSPEFQALEDRLMGYVVNYRKRIVQMRERFQF